MSDVLSCRYVGRCGGCPSGGENFDSVLSAKSAPVRTVSASLEMRFSARGRVRDRADLVWEKGADGSMHLGLYGLNDRAVVDLEACPMMSESLEAWFKEFRLRAPPIVRGSVRLRVSPSGERGVWLDFANQDVKMLFAEREYLQWLNARAFVEIGQRRKALVWREGAPKLVEPELRPWFETYDGFGNAIPLYGPVGGFSQTGFAANRALVDAVSELAAASGVRDWLELFCGNGNFALALAARGYSVEAIELDELAVRGLQKSGGGVRILRQDVYLKSGNLPPIGERGLLVDPPRAGLREVLGEMAKGWRPRALLYVSCYTDVFVQDSARLAELGYIPAKILGVDQFPYSPHGEWIALFQRDVAANSAHA